MTLVTRKVQCTVPTCKGKPKKTAIKSIGGLDCIVCSAEGCMEVISYTKQQVETVIPEKTNKPIEEGEVKKKKPVQKQKNTSQTNLF